MLCAGFYLSAVHMAHDTRLRRVIKASAGSKVFGAMATAQLEQEIEKRVLNIMEKEQRIIKEETGIHPSLEQKDVKTYLDSVLVEIQSKKDNKESNHKVAAGR
jgi:predicted acylesterase/phospholipase RssA